jgi:hypothetical protein
MAEKKKRRNIRIHPDHIENLDEKYKKLEMNSQEAVFTGYHTVCKVRNYLYNNKWFKASDVLFTSKFVEEKMPTRAFIIFNEIRKGRNGAPEKTGNVMFQPAKQEWMNRTHINHVVPRGFSRLRKFGYRAPLDSTPPSQIFYEYGIGVKAKYYYFRLVEYRVKDEYDGDVFAYKLVPLSNKPKVVR